MGELDELDKLDEMDGMRVSMGNQSAAKPTLVWLHYSPGITHRHTESRQVLTEDRW